MSEHRAIPLSRGKSATVDAADYEALSGFGWYALKSKSGVWYAARSCHAPLRGVVLMHRQILGISGEAKVDHRNGDGLDNRRRNLRAATGRQNNANATLRNRLGFKGVYLYRGKFGVRIRDGGVRTYLGTFEQIEDAARAYDAAARRHFGEFACTNYPEGDERPARNEGRES